jgi:hypothetical protein
MHFHAQGMGLLSQTEKIALLPKFKGPASIQPVLLRFAFSVLFHNRSLFTGVKTGAKHQKKTIKGQGNIGYKTVFAAGSG